MENGIKDKAERIKAKAEIFLKNKTKTFIVDSFDNYYFCDIISVEEDYLIVLGFAGRRKFERDKIYFVDVLRLEEYKEVVVKK